MELLIKLLDDMCFAAIPALGFAMLFNVPKDALKYCAALGAIAHGFRTLMIYFDTPLVLATFIASATIGFIGIHISQRYLAHPKVFTVAAIIPMIPGVYAYKAMIAVVEINYYGFSDERLVAVLENFIKTGFILGALVFGLALPRMLFERNKPVI